MLFVCQLLIEASDQGTPERHVSLTIYVTIKRSVRAPRFDNLPFQLQRVSETQPVGRELVTVKAHDPDLVVSNDMTQHKTFLQHRHENMDIYTIMHRLKYACVVIFYCCYC